MALSFGVEDIWAGLYAQHNRPSGPNDEMFGAVSLQVSDHQM